MAKWNNDEQRSACDPYSLRSSDAGKRCAPKGQFVNCECSFNRSGGRRAARQSAGLGEVPRIRRQPGRDPRLAERRRPQRIAPALPPEPKRPRPHETCPARWVAAFSRHEHAR